MALRVEVIALQARNWGQATSVAAGFERASSDGTHRLRALVVFVGGFTPFGQFTIEQKLRNGGVQLQIEF